MKVKIPVEVDLNGIDGIVDEIKCLQKYKLSDDDEMELVSLDDVAEILINHIEAREKSEPQRMRGRWVGTEFDGYADGNPVYYEWKCSACGCVVEDEEPTWNYCPNCGADMRESK